ncbi:hypothetical protein CPB83DRAFT_902052 [Crepidotus variabilis]|uniref:FAD-binding domain-containing protein n=1 Tax=Crepidotus variabilis TaxID=179855 RepID=A0A9P6ES93_9AGAR|nr:hypothetical protein CPB83DRAFT_902052 [Crepidotus variabilis]
MNQPAILPQEVLQIIVVGAGISGLAAAYGLRKSGHDVLIVEKTDGSENYVCLLRIPRISCDLFFFLETNETIPSPPNMTQMLAKLGLTRSCKSFFQRTRRCDFIDANSGSLIGSLPAKLFQIVARDAKAEYGTLEGRSLQDVLRRKCEESGVNIRFSTPVAGVMEDILSTCVELENGEKLYADLIVGADGYNSGLRSHVVFQEQPEIGPKVGILRVSIPTKRLQQDPNLRPLLALDSWETWFGTGVQCRFLVLPQQRERCEAVFSYTITSEFSQICNKWKIIEDSSMSGLDVSALEPRLQKLIKIGDRCELRVIKTLPPADTLVSIPKKIILVGSAAHSLAPGTHQDTAMDLEDAYTLGFLFSKLQNKDQLPKIISVYDEIRHPHALHVHKFEVSRTMSSKAPPGPLRSVRDERLRKICHYNHEKTTAEEAVLAGWGPELSVVTYDASAAAQDWWNQYGLWIIDEEESGESVVGESEVRVSVKRKSESRHISFFC